MFDPSQSVPPATGTWLDLDAYFQLDSRFPDTKYEYEAGQIRAMSGGSIAHDALAFNMRLALSLAFASGPCSVHGSDVRVQVAEQSYFFPDVTVTCDVADRRRDNKMIRSPRLVVEILSPSTERADRGSKLQAYQACPSIQEIVLVNQFAPYVEVYRRSEGQTWSQINYAAGTTISLESLDVEVSIDDLYRGIDFDEPLIND